MMATERMMFRIFTNWLQSPIGAAAQAVLLKWARKVIGEIRTQKGCSAQEIRQHHKPAQVIQDIRFPLGPSFAWSNLPHEEVNNGRCTELVHGQHLKVISQIVEKIPHVNLLSVNVECTINL